MTVDALPYVVVFDMWGQRCQTTFDAASELDPLEWIMRCWDQGFMEPVEVLVNNVVIATTTELRQVLEYYQNGMQVGRIRKL